MPAPADNSFYALLDFIAQTVGDEDTVQQNECIKGERLARDSAELNKAQTATIHVETKAGKHHTSPATGTSNDA